MKYLSTSLIVLALLAIVAIPTVSLAAEEFKLTPDCDATLPPSDPKACNVEAFIAWVSKIINYLFIISVPIATAFIVYGAFVMMKSGGNPGEFAKGKGIVYSAVIGIIIIFTSNIIVTTVASALKGATN